VIVFLPAQADIRRRKEAAMLRMFLAAALIVAAMVVIKDGRVVQDAGLTGSCSSAVTPAGETGVWKACRPGKLDGRPDLSRKACTVSGISGTVQFWRCPAPIGGAAGT
jgi:hypothetical protein